MPKQYAWPLAAAVLLALGAGFLPVDPAIGHGIWSIGVVIVGFPLVMRTMGDALRGRFATDVVASLSIIGAIWFGQPVAGLVIVLMQTGGEALERYAEGRASSAVRALEEAAPRIAHVERDGLIADVPAPSVRVGEVLVVRPGDLLPCDGVVLDGESELDVSSMTGEAIPIRVTAGVTVMSGTANGLGSFRMRATRAAGESQYARIVALVRNAQASKSPLQRTADRYAAWFTPFTLVVCALAVALSHDRLRALAILVVATPCPLILATPVAIIGGINRAARRFIIVRSGAAIERLESVDTVVFDKTGTLTVGKPRIQAVHVAPGFERRDVMRLAGSAEDRSTHLLARVLVDAARSDGITLGEATSVVEQPGQGIAAVVDGVSVRVGARAFVMPSCDDGLMMAAQLEHAGATLRAYIAIGDRLAGVVEYADELRAELPAVLDAFRAAGIQKMVLLSGDHGPIARAVGQSAGLTEAYGDLLPEDKARFIERLQAEGHVVMMIGDGVNDAPALGTADVGVALSAHGASIAAEAADLIVLVDALARAHDALLIGRRTMRIARQSIVAGLGLSGIAMIVAAFGGIPPVYGAGIQEVIDVAAILNALRASRHVSWPRRPTPGQGGRSERVGLSFVSAVRA